jgi:hypothetical protein
VRPSPSARSCSISSRYTCSYVGRRDCSTTTVSSWASASTSSTSVSAASCAVSICDAASCSAQPLRKASASAHLPSMRRGIFAHCDAERSSGTSSDHQAVPTNAPGRPPTSFHARTSQYSGTISFWPL